MDGPVQSCTSEILVCRNCIFAKLLQSRGANFGTCQRARTDKGIPGYVETAILQHYFKVEDPTLEPANMLELTRGSELLDWVSEDGLIQIFTCPSRHAVRIDSWVNIMPDKGSVWTRWATTGESLGTSLMHGAGWRVPNGVMLSQWADWLPALNVGDPPGGQRRRGTTISSIDKSHKSNCVSCEKAYSFQIKFEKGRLCKANAVTKHETKSRFFFLLHKQPI